MTSRVIPSLVPLAMLFLLGCSNPEPLPIDYGNAQCTACKMTVADPRFGAELVANTGKVYVFDAPECMLGWYLAAEAVPTSSVHSLWVSDHAAPATLIDATTAVYLESEELHSPMSMNVAAFATEEARRAAQARYGGIPLTFKDVLTLAEDYR